MGLGIAGVFCGLRDEPGGLGGAPGGEPGGPPGGEPGGEPGGFDGPSGPFWLDGRGEIPRGTIPGKVGMNGGLTGSPGGEPGGVDGPGGSF